MSDIMSDMKTIAKRVKKKSAPSRRKPEPRREFTVRDLNRHTAELLDAARKHGSVIVRSRGGEAFTVRAGRVTEALDFARRKMELRASLEDPKRDHMPEINLEAAQDFAARQVRYRAKLRALVGKCPTKIDVERINRIIAGEE